MASGLVDLYVQLHNAASDANLAEVLAIADKLIAHGRCLDEIRTYENGEFIYDASVLGCAATARNEEEAIKIVQALKEKGVSLVLTKDSHSLVHAAMFANRSRMLAHLLLVEHLDPLLRGKFNNSPLDNAYFGDTPNTEAITAYFEILLSNPAYDRAQIKALLDFESLKYRGADKMNQVKAHAAEILTKMQRAADSADKKDFIAEFIACCAPSAFVGAFEGVAAAGAGSAAADASPAIASRK